MRYEAKMRRLARSFPKPLPEVIVSWGPSKDKPDEIFSTKGWGIRIDESGQLEKRGDVPARYTADLLRQPTPKSENVPRESRITRMSGLQNPDQCDLLALNASAC